MAKLGNIRPGEVLLEPFLGPMGFSQNRPARNMGLPPRRINEIVHDKRAVTADTALRLGLYFGASDGLWMSLQADYALKEARDRLGGRLKRGGPNPRGVTRHKKLKNQNTHFYSPGYLICAR